MIGGNGGLFLVFTDSQGGRYNLRDTTLAEYEAVKESGVYDDTPPDQDPDSDVRAYVKVKFVALVRVEDNFDFGLGRSREAEALTV